MERPNNTCCPKIPYNKHEKHIINTEIEKLDDSIIKREREDTDYVSTVFTREKKDGSFKTISNVKCLNKFFKCRYFKMELLKNVFKIVKQGVWMASVDLKGAFFIVSVHKSHQRYPKSEWFKVLCYLQFLKNTKYARIVLNHF